MNRRWRIGAALSALVWTLTMPALGGAELQAPLERYRLIPYPQKVTASSGSLRISSQPHIVVEPGAQEPVRIGQEQLIGFFAKLGLPQRATERTVRISIGTIEQTKEAGRWFDVREQQALSDLHSQGYLLRVGPGEVAILGRTSLGALNGVQTLLQLLDQSRPGLLLPLMKIVDYPEVPDRYLAIQLAWYAGVPGQQTFGFGSQLWTERQWKWFVDWCLRHRINGLDLCIYGRWPFPFPEFPETTLAGIPVKTSDEKTGKIVTRLMTHPNIEREFLPAVIRYAQARGIRVNAYIGLNSYNGSYLHRHPEAHPFLAAQAGGRTYSYDELDLSQTQVREYLRASLRRIMRMGFDGVTFEQNESTTMVCTKPACVPLFWKGFEHLVTPASMPALTPIEVRIRADAHLLNDLYEVIKGSRVDAEVGLIYHLLEYRYGWSEATLDALKALRAAIPSQVFFTQGPRAPLTGELTGSRLAQWVDIVNPRTYRHGSNIGGPPTIFFNNDPETRGDGGANDYWLWPLTLEIAQHRAAAKLRLRGTTGYAFSWYGQEILPLILSQYGWRTAGPEGVSDKGFLQYASQAMYGRRVGNMVAKALSLPPPGDPHYRLPANRRHLSGEAVLLAGKALADYDGAESEYRLNLEHLYTANQVRAENFRLQQLLQAATKIAGPEKKAWLKKALAQAERVRMLVLRGKPRILYGDPENSLLINYTRIMPEYYGKSVIDFPPIAQVRQKLDLLETKARSRSR